MSNDTDAAKSAIEVFEKEYAKGLKDMSNDTELCRLLRLIGGNPSRAADRIEALQAAINQIIATVEYETDNSFHLEYCPHGAEWGKCSRCPPTPPGR
jgi:hypothetical protein